MKPETMSLRAFSILVGKVAAFSLIIGAIFSFIGLYSTQGNVSAFDVGTASMALGSFIMAVVTLVFIISSTVFTIIARLEGEIHRNKN